MQNIFEKFKVEIESSTLDEETKKVLLDKVEDVKNKKINIKSPDEVANLFIEEMRYLKKEYFKVLLLNTKNEIIMIENISVGSLNSSVVHPREVFCTAIKKYLHTYWRDGRVVDCGGLENR